MSPLIVKTAQLMYHYGVSTAPIEKMMRYLSIECSAVTDIEPLHSRSNRIPIPSPSYLLPFIRCVETCVG
jgi:hypothetical protein